MPLVVDTSAWVRQRDVDVRGRWKATLAAGLVAVCPVAALEILAGARDEDGFRALARTLAALPQAPVTTSVCAAALGAARDLRGSRRLPAAVYLIAAAAAERGFGVLHLDGHFDTLASVLASSAFVSIAAEQAGAVASAIMVAARGHEQAGTHPVVVISHDAFNAAGRLHSANLR